MCEKAIIQNLTRSPLECLTLLILTKAHMSLLRTHNWLFKKGIQWNFYLPDWSRAASSTEKSNGFIKGFLFQLENDK